MQFGSENLLPPTKFSNNFTGFVPPHNNELGIPSARLLLPLARPDPRQLNALPSPAQGKP